MSDLEPRFEANLIEAHNIVWTKISGFWTSDKIQAYFDAVNETSMPLVKARKPIFAMVDLGDFVAQDRATGDAITDHLQQACKFGMTKLAVIGASALVKIQYRRLSKGVHVEFFDDTKAAEDWLRLH